MSSTPKRRVTVTVNGKSYTVEVGDLSESPISVSVNGKPYVVNVTAEVEKVAGESAAAPESAARTVSVAQPPPSTASRAAGSGKDVTAPMPGLIIEVMVQSGAQVKAGDTLCSLEAMKMKNSIRSPRDGTVATVAVNPGQKVAHGEVLVTFE